MLLRVANLVHTMGKLTACRKAGEDHVATEGKKVSRKLVAVACTLGNVEFHHLKVRPRNKACPPSCQMKRLTGIPAGRRCLQVLCIAIRMSAKRNHPAYGIRAAKFFYADFSPAARPKGCVPVELLVLPCAYFRAVQLLSGLKS